MRFSDTCFCTHTYIHLDLGCPESESEVYLFLFFFFGHWCILTYLFLHNHEKNRNAIKWHLDTPSLYVWGTRQYGKCLWLESGRFFQHIGKEQWNSYKSIFITIKIGHCACSAYIALMWDCTALEVTASPLCIHSDANTRKIKTGILWRKALKQSVT